ncbi:MAG: ThiF family adenylyltransferase [Xanthomonadales bacterium]|nr:ThiF family adenylyltransferase [Xanthomonadales bacterium]
MSAIRLVPPVEAARLAASGARLVDVRSWPEYASAHASGAIWLPRGRLEREAERLLGPAPLVLLCATGPRALAAAEALAAAGRDGIYVVAGGTRAWQAAGLPMAEAKEDPAWLERYGRQIALPEVGPEGQRRLGRARVGLVGVGGLGSPAALYLAGAGVGTLRLADPDRLERGNLHRQILHGEDWLGRPKLASARARLASLNPEVALECWEEAVGAGNVARFLEGCDVVVDGSDRIGLRYLLADAARAARVPLVHAAVEGFSGLLAVFDPRLPEAPCFRCLFPEEAAPEPPSCAERGVLGPVPGVFGCLQALEALKLLLGVGEGLAGRVLVADLLTMRLRMLRLPRDPGCRCAGGATSELAPGGAEGCVDG